MILATDVHYDEALPCATAAGVGFLDWADAAPAQEFAVPVAGIAGYEPGAFYLRELPCLLALIDSITTPVSTVIVDGHVHLDNGRMGLGAHLHAALAQANRVIPIVGVAKNAFRGAPSIPVLRGGSQRPLHVTAEGMEPSRAAELVARMHGPHRLPTLLKRVDRLCRDAHATAAERPNP